MALELRVMLKLWLTFFILGNLCGRMVPVALLAAAVLPIVSRAFGLRLLVAGSAFIWGATHAAPARIRSCESMQIVNASLGDGSSGPLLVRCGQQVYESYGRRIDGALGRVVVPEPEAPRLFSRASSYVVLTGARLTKSSLPRRWAEAMRARLQAGFGRNISLPRGWGSALVLGDKRDLPWNYKEAFKLIGIYHLLIVSGLHVTLVVSLCALAVRLPLQIAYALRLIPSALWPELVAGMRIMVAAFATVYLLMAGMPAAAQRAALLFVIYQFTGVFLGSLPLPLRLQFGAFMQTLLFPIGFVSEATLMTWGAYLMVVQIGHGKLKQTLLLQVQLMVLVAAVFGQVSPLGIGTNLCLVPLLGLLLASALLLSCWPTLPGRAGVLAFHASFSESVRYIAGLTERWPWLAPTPGSLPLWFRALALLISVILLLNACRDLTIRRYDLR